MTKISKLHVAVALMAIGALVIGFFYIEEVERLGVVIFKILLLILKAL